MGRLITGITIILFILVIGFLVTVISGEAAQSSPYVNCKNEGDANFTQCENVGKTSFFMAVKNTAVGDFGPDTPAWITALWVLIAGILLTTAIFLIVQSFIPLLSE